MNEEQIDKMLDKEYEIKMKGSMLGYLLNLLSEQQRALNEQMADNITDAMAAMAAAANNLVGNSLLHEVYRSAGAKFLAFSLGIEEDAMKKIMTSDSPEEIKKAAQKAMKNHPLNKGKLN